MGKDGFDYFENAKKVTGSEPVQEARVEKFHRSGLEDFEFNTEEINAPF
jgi:hypothetical protein